MPKDYTIRTESGVRIVSAESCPTVWCNVMRDICHMCGRALSHCLSHEQATKFQTCVCCKESH